MSIRTRFRSAGALVLLVAAAVTAAPRAYGQDAPEDPAKAQIRERFRAGMEKYQQGAYREAIGYWEAIYREMGAREGYRLSFNLARAYEKFSDFTVAAERYEAFLTEVELRRQESKALDPVVEREEKEAKERLEELRASKGRLKVNAAKLSLDAKVDEADRRAAGFIAYVAPGKHVVVFVRGNETLEKREVDVKAGELLEVAPPAMPEPVVPPPLKTTHEVSHPFTPAVLYVAGAVTLVSIIVPVLTYNHAGSIKRQHDAMLDANGGTDATLVIQARNLEDDYLTARTTAYATLAIPASFAAITGGLVAWYFLGEKEREVVVRPEAGPTSLGISSQLRF
jgi:hypothetical protein